MGEGAKGAAGGGGRRLCGCGGCEWQGEGEVGGVGVPRGVDDLLLSPMWPVLGSRGIPGLVLCAGARGHPTL